jgi:8-hydroxy-5-deazaflavin:NADPH oxidoreductase
MKTVGIIGSGRIGGTVARLAVAAGYSVIVSNSRSPRTLTGLVNELGPNARAATPSEAADGADLVVVSLPLRAYPDVPVEPLAGKTVIDTNNYNPERDGHVIELDTASTTSSELLQKHLPTSHVVKAFNNIFFQTLRTLPRRAGALDRTTLPIAGDDTDAKAEVTAFLDAIGYGALDAGPLAEGRRWQPGTPAHLVYAGDTIQAAVPSDAEKVRRALGAATR